MPPDPLILGFDTSAAHCAAALLSGERVIAARVEPMARGQAERLIPMLEELLAEAGRDWHALSALGVGIGPGNFTGVRIAVSAARGLALGLEIPAVGVSGLEAAAFDAPRPVIACLPAPRGRLYAQGFGTGPDTPALLEPVEVPQGIMTVGPASGAEAIAQIAARRWQEEIAPPKPLYIRPPDAALPSEPPARILDDA